MRIHDDTRHVTVTDNEGARAHAVPCFLVDGHWWVVEVCGDRDRAANCLRHLKEHLKQRCLVQLNVAPTDVRPDLGRQFFISIGFQKEAADDQDRYPMCWRSGFVR